MKAFLCNGLFLLCLLTSVSVHGAAGDVDLSFDAGSKLSGPAYTIAEQPDGRILIGGEFSTVAGAIRHGIARLKADGTADTSFDPGMGPNGLVRCIVLQPDGKVLMGGWFTSVNGVSRNRIARLNSDGSVDQSFDPGVGPDDLVFSLALQSDGKILVGGYFTHVAGLNHSYLARLNTNGSVDTNFVGSADSYVYSLIVQSDDKILVGGTFASIAGTNVNRIARLNADGSFDSSFNPGSGVGYFGVSTMALQPDGSVLIGGSFQTVNGAQHANIARLTSNGSVDANFIATANGEVGSIALQADGRIIVGGQFQNIDGVNRASLARLNTNGTLDAAYNPPLNTTPPGITSLTLTADGKLLVSGYFDFYFARLDTNGGVDASLSPSTGIDGALVFMSQPQPDGKILIAGNFHSVKGQLRQGIARLESSGSLDPTFDPGPMLNIAYYSLSNPVVYSVALQSDGKLIIGGAFTNINGFDRRNVARLNNDGSVDTSFNPGAGTDYNVYQVLLQTDGKVLISGGFDSVDNMPRHYFARLNSDGSLDTTFNPDLGNLPMVVLQPDGKILVAGSIVKLNGIPTNSVGRLNSDGSLDNTFMSVPFDNFVTSVMLLADGRILVGGWFETAAGSPRNRLACLNPDGSLNADFHPPGPDDQLSWTLFGTTALEQPDGKLLVWGDFTHFNGIACPGLVRLLPNGEVDASFDAGAGPNAFLASLAWEADGRILLSGGFSSVNGVPRGLVARLESETPIIPQPPVINLQPTNQTVFVGRDVVFSVTAEGAPTLVYQWYRDGVPLIDGRRVSGATTARLQIQRLQFRDSGVYSVTITNSDGSVSSDPAVLKVVPPGKGSFRPLARQLNFGP